MINTPAAQTILEDESGPAPSGCTGGGRLILASKPDFAASGNRLRVGRSGAARAKGSVRSIKDKQEPHGREFKTDGGEAADVLIIGERGAPVHSGH